MGSSYRKVVRAEQVRAGSVIAVVVAVVVSVVGVVVVAVAVARAEHVLEKSSCVLSEEEEEVGGKESSKSGATADSKYVEYRECKYGFCGVWGCNGGIMLCMLCMFCVFD